MRREVNAILFVSFTLLSLSPIFSLMANGMDERKQIYSCKYGREGTALLVDQPMIIINISFTTNSFLNLQVNSNMTLHPRVMECIMCGIPKKREFKV